MTPQERELILGVAEQLKAADRTEKDPEAERLIRGAVAGQPDAVYLLTQRVIVQDLALREARKRIEELEGGAQPGGSGRSFLGGAAGGGAGQVPPASNQQPGPAPTQAAPAGGGGSAAGSFLKSAAAAAAGTIAGQLVYDGIRRYVGDMGHGMMGGGFPPVARPIPGPEVGDAIDLEPDRDRTGSFGGTGRGGEWGGDAGGGGDWGGGAETDAGAGGDWGTDPGSADAFGPVDDEAGTDTADDIGEDEDGGDDFSGDVAGDDSGGGGDW